MENARTPPATHAAFWPVILNFCCWLLMLKLLMESTRDPMDATLIGLAAVGASAINILGALIALLRRNRPVAAWYGLALLTTLVLGAVAIGLVDVDTLNRDE